MKKIQWEKIFYYKLSKTQFQELHPEIDRHNLSMLIKIAVMALFIRMVMISFPLFFEHDIAKTLVLIGSALIITLIAVVALRYQKKGNASHQAIKDLHYYYIATELIFGIANAGLTPNFPASLILITYILAQTIFIVPFFFDFILVTGFQFVFLIVVFFTKEPILFGYDFVHSTVAIFVGSFIGWFFSANRLSELREKKKLILLTDELYKASVIDRLTTLPNRQSMIDLLGRVVESSNRIKTGLCCLSIDIDYFKEYNDFYGHPKGDDIIHNIGKVFQGFYESEKISIGRVGGDEFLAVWETDNFEKCTTFCHDLLYGIRGLKIAQAPSVSTENVTITIGCYFKTPEQITSAIELYTLADQKLYLAKKDGRDRALCFDSKTDSSVLIK